MPYQVNRERLGSMLQELAQFGSNAGGGIDRTIGSQADLDARRYLVQKCAEAGACVHADAFANLYARVPGTADLPPIAIGSHHDAVPDGGRYDGAMGVLLGLEVLLCLQEQGLRLRHPFQIVMFTAEEPNPFGISTMGSRAVTGKLSLDTLRHATSCRDGSALQEALQAAGGDLQRYDESQMRPGQMRAFFECHIEQGRNLDQMGLGLAAVSKITGIYREHVTLRGEANHAGTTHMEDRRDALCAAAELVLAFEAAVRAEKSPEIVGTVGRLTLRPNATNIIPAEVELIMELRAPDEGAKQRVLAALALPFARIASARGVSIARAVTLDQAPVHMDADLLRMMQEEVAKVQGRPVTLVSMAGHDAVHMTGICPTEMLFVRSIDGKSHCAQEKSRLADIAAAGDVLLACVLRLDQELDKG